MKNASNINILVDGDLFSVHGCTMKYAQAIEEQKTPEVVELETLTRFMDRLERIQNEIGDIVREADQLFMEKKTAYETKKKQGKAA